MSWAQTLNSSNVGQALSNNMQSIKLSTDVSDAEIKAKVAIEEAKNKKTDNKEENNTQNQQVQNQPQAQAQTQVQPQTQMYPQVQQYMPNVQYQTVPFNYQPYQVQSANATMAPSNAANAYQAQVSPQAQNGQNIDLTTANVQQ